MPPVTPNDDQFDRFELIEEISVSNASVVWKANGYSGDTKQELAYKTVQKQHWDSGAQLDHIVTETNVLDKLQDCSGVPTIVDHGTIPRPWIATRLFHRPSLDESIVDFGIRNGLELIRDLCKTIQCAHDRGIIHGDIKSKNVLPAIDESESSIVLDWGGADELSNPSSTVVSLPYAAPEQLSDEALTPQTDIYQLGVLTYETLTSIRPFQASNESEYRTKIEAYEPTPIHVLASDHRFQPIDQVLESALATNPEDRYNSPKELYTAILEAIEIIGSDIIRSSVDEGEFAGIAFPEVSSSSFGNILNAVKAGYDVDTIRLDEWNVLSQLSYSLSDNRRVCPNSDCNHIQYDLAHQITSDCPHCGTTLDHTLGNAESSTTATVSAKTTIIEEETNVCESCGNTDIKADARFCPECGWDLHRLKDSETIISTDDTKDSETIINTGDTQIALGGGVDPVLILHLIEAGVVIIQGTKYAKSGAEYVKELLDDFESTSDTPNSDPEELSEEELEELLDQYVIEDELEWQ